jgi:hypothetical protein
MSRAIFEIFDSIQHGSAIPVAVLPENGRATQEQH